MILTCVSLNYLELSWTSWKGCEIFWVLCRESHGEGGKEFKPTLIHREKNSLIPARVFTRVHLTRSYREPVTGFDIPGYFLELKSRSNHRRLKWDPPWRFPCQELPNGVSRFNCPVEYLSLYSSYRLSLILTAIATRFDLALSNFFVLLRTI